MRNVLILLLFAMPISLSGCGGTTPSGDPAHIKPKADKPPATTTEGTAGSRTMDAL